MVCTRLMKWKWKETNGFRRYLRNSFNVTSMLDFGRCRRKGDVKDNFYISNLFKFLSQCIVVPITKKATAEGGPNFVGEVLTFEQRW